MEPDSNDCWVWPNAKDKDGYGIIKLAVGTARVHRLMAGEPEGLVLHSCDNPPCCNPAHLRVGSHSDNIQDRRQRGWFRRAGYCRKALHPMSGSNLGIHKNGDRYCKACHKVTMKNYKRKRGLT